jgi:hypothetical protein
MRFRGQSPNVVGYSTGWTWLPVLGQNLISVDGKDAFAQPNQSPANVSHDHSRAADHPPGHVPVPRFTQFSSNSRPSAISPSLPHRI